MLLPASLLRSAVAERNGGAGSTAILLRFLLRDELMAEGRQLTYAHRSEAASGITLQRPPLSGHVRRSRATTAFPSPSNAAQQRWILCIVSFSLLSNSRAVTPSFDDGASTMELRRFEQLQALLRRHAAVGSGDTLPSSSVSSVAERNGGAGSTAILLRFLLRDELMAEGRQLTYAHRSEAASGITLQRPPLSGHVRRSRATMAFPSPSNAAQQRWVLEVTFHLLCS
nr:hypothetical protein Iba_chr07bCG7210 [Ipomoea batatas]